MPFPPRGQTNRSDISSLKDNGAVEKRQYQSRYGFGAVTRCSLWMDGRELYTRKGENYNKRAVLTIPLTRCWAALEKITSLPRFGQDGRTGLAVGFLQ